MIARLTVAMPFDMAVPENATFNTYEYQEQGFRIVHFPPVKTDVPLNGTNPASMRIDEKPAFLVNGLVIEFHKETFQRTRGGTWDPPPELMSGALNELLGRIRFVTRGHQIRPSFSLEQSRWRLQYLNDDGTELPEDPDLWRALGGLKTSVSIVGVTPSIWDELHLLPEGFEPPAWDTLWLDAAAALPHVGTALVLAMSSLEVFISVVLDRLATASSIPTEMWSWVNERQQRLSNPSTDEQFDILLKVFTNHSLKEDERLWESYRHLKSARNSYVHEGIAAIGKDRDIVSLTKASQLVTDVGMIINLIRQWLPEDQRWPQVQAKITLQFAIMFPGFEANPELSSK